ncbi:hypothetical protein P153DRAFT_360606 [Dothidotthia symphoricarpi CBS 119687]|uniref:RanBP2-type domain-containing protein n=1 Tax=Dothidotthia symphoricarpi CBS 119687 TaxID=1392245 RepID=A0A6A6A313_9PLEO|nr:uncharacterized protein P153DRAFT_360606 [Dothidotthia symphoricarpi CBS 119687]KAF2124971.1 hypothetical protein P153DRAFT_360606 [Dothidotthia symphoricarpi CBS 119687]
MDIPRGHARLPLNESDFLDFIFNYFKAEYSPIRSFWSTAIAAPRQPGRWINMGHESQPLAIRPANAQAQKDLESLDYFIRKWNLDAGFVRGLVIRYAKYEIHERLEKKLYECSRLDLMLRKALKEKHLVDALWPSPAPRDFNKELLAQGVQVRRWYGDMFSKYFQVLHSIDDFKLRPEVDTKIKSSGTLMLVPFVDHLVFGGVDPILPIVAQGDGYSKLKTRERRDGGKAESGFGEPDRFEIRFDAPAEVVDTYTKSVVRQCQCMKCGSKRDVQVVVSVDPNPSAASGSSSKSPKTSDQGRNSSKTTQKYSPGYNMPGEDEAAPAQPPRPQTQTEQPSSSEQKKQCERCTFLNHPELTLCEMCQADLPDATIPKPSSPVVSKKASHSHSVSLPPPTTAAQQANKNADLRPPAPNRHSLSSTLFSIFPFSQQHQQEHHAKLPPTQQTDTSSAAASRSETHTEAKHDQQRPSSSKSNRHVKFEATPTEVESPSSVHTPPSPPDREATPPLSQRPEMAMMPLTPPPSASQTRRQIPVGLPSNLMDDFVPTTPAFPREEDDEGAGWGEVSREETRREESSDDEEDEEEGSGGVGLVDLDAVAREEMGVWGERETDD